MSESSYNRLVSRDLCDNRMVTVERAVEDQGKRLRLIEIWRAKQSGFILALSTLAVALSGLSALASVAQWLRH